MTPETQVNSKLKWQEPNTLTNVCVYICPHSSTIPRLTYWRWSPPIVFRISQQCTLFNRTVRNCMLHSWLLYLSVHLKPMWFSEVSIMSNEYTWIWICHRVCIFTCKIARIYAHVFIYTENMLTKFYYHHYQQCIYCTLVHFMFACLPLFCYFHFCFCSLISFIIIIFFITPKILQKCYVCYFFIVTRHWLIVE